jgi:uncharacterized NAD(P)/FAD-binding protein YdhS
LALRHRWPPPCHPVDLAGAALDERARFLRHLQPYWDTHRHRIAAGIGQLVADTRESGQLDAFAGRLVGVDGSTVRVKPRLDDELMLDVARIINCTGPAISLTSVNDPLVERLLARGLATSDPLNLGFRTARDGRLVDAHGQPSERIQPRTHASR